MVWGKNEESLECAAGVERVFGGECEFGFGGVCGVCDWDGDAGVDLVALDSLWSNRVAAYVRVCATDGGDGVELVDG